MPRPLRLLALCGWFLGLAQAASAGQFVYVGQPADFCGGSVQCAPPKLLVYDAATAALVTEIILPVSPVAIAIAPNGRHVYTASADQIVAIDTLRHQVDYAAPIPGSALLQMAVQRDDRRVFLHVSPTQVLAFDTSTRTIAFDISLSGSIEAVTTNPSRDVVHVRRHSSGPQLFLTDVDATTGGVLSEQQYAAAVLMGTLTASPDGDFVYLDWYPFLGGTTYTRVHIVESVTKAFVADSCPKVIFSPKSGIAPGTAGRFLFVPVFFPAQVRVCLANPSESAPHVETINLNASGVAGVLDDTRLFAVTDGTEGASFDIPTPHLTVASVATGAIELSIALPTPAGRMLVATPVNVPTCNYRLSTNQSSWTINGGSAPITLTTDCAWQASSSAPWARLSASSGVGSATLTLTVDSNFTTTNRSATLTIGGQLVTVTQASFAATPPFGSFDTPVDNTIGVTGTLAVTGWVLDDVGVTRVRIMRDPVAGEFPGAQIFIGEATFVEGARPDVQAFFPALPNSARAGWGLSVLTNMLPGGGNGTYRLYAYADDVDGHTTLLGFKAFTAANSTATVPFGTIDTPASGATVSGVIANFGWALTPLPNSIPLDGSTIDVFVDNVFVGRPIYNQFRSDIAALFPSYMNSDGAVGVFMLDTTQYANGVHTIAWVVRDTGGNAAGIGSRYFTIQNP